MPTGICPECDSDIHLTDEEFNDIVTCDDCGVELEIVGLDPVELEIFEEEDYDQDDDDDY